MDVVSLLTSVGSSGVFVVAANVWVSKRSERSQKDASKRVSDREPLVLKGVELQNTAKVVHILQQGIDTLEDANKRAAEEFREAKGKLEDQVESLIDDKRRLHAQVTQNSDNYTQKVNELTDMIINLQAEIRVLKKDNDNLS